MQTFSPQLQRESRDVEINTTHTILEFLCLLGKYIEGKDYHYI